MVTYFDIRGSSTDKQCTGKNMEIPVQAWRVREVSRSLRHDKVVNVSVRAPAAFTPKNIPGNYCY